MHQRRHRARLRQPRAARPAAPASAPPTGTLQIVLRPQSFQLVDLPPKRSGDGPPSPGDASITTYRVFDASGAKRLGRADFVCTTLDRRGEHEQCTGTIALPDGQLATQGDADNVAIVGGTGAYAGARGTATGPTTPTASTSPSTSSPKQTTEPPCRRRPSRGGTEPTNGPVWTRPGSDGRCSSGAKPRAIQ